MYLIYTKFLFSLNNLISYLSHQNQYKSSQQAMKTFWPIQFINSRIRRRSDVVKGARCARLQITPGRIRLLEQGRYTGDGFSLISPMIRRRCTIDLFPPSPFVPSAQNTRRASHSDRTLEHDNEQPLTRRFWVNAIRNICLTDKTRG